RSRSQRGHRESEVELGPDRRRLEAALEPALAQPRIDDRRLEARVAADEEAGIGFFDAGDGGVEEVAGAARRIERGAVLAAIEMGRAQLRHQILERHHRLAIDEVTRDGGDLVARDRLEALRDDGEGLAPLGLDELAVAPHIRAIEALAAQAVNSEARLV